MKTKTLKKIWIALSVLVLAALACQVGTGGVTTPTASPSDSSSTPTESPTTAGVDRDHLMRSTVLVNMEVKQGNGFVWNGSGSGTIISEDGLILTNAHVASPASQGDPSNEPDRLTIAITQSEDQPPVLSYVAEVLAVDGTLDLAVLQIATTLNGSSIDKSELRLPFVEIGNSSDVHIGDHLNILGFPGVGFDTITYTEGSVAGFLAEDPVGDRAWIKTAANVAHGNSGGLAANDAGKIIAVPTAVNGDCDPVDSNGDGELDNCIPNGNSINFLRPVNWAMPLIEAARAGKEYASKYDVPGVATESGSGEEAATGFVWLDTSNSSGGECKRSDEIVSAYPDSALCIVAGFEYSGMSNGEPVRELWFLDNEAVSEFPYAWEWDAEGRFATSLTNKGDPLPTGEYYLEMYAGEDDHLIGTSDKVVIGDGTGTDQPAPPPQEDTVTVFGVITDVDTNKPISGAYVFVVGGVTYEEWQSANFDEKYIVAAVQVGADGKYEITGVPRGAPLTYVYSAQGYYDVWLNDAEIPVDDPATRFELNAQLAK